MYSVIIHSVTPTFCSTAHLQPHVTLHIIIPLLNNNNKYLVSAQYQYRQISKFMISESELKKVDQCISNTLVMMTLWQMFACTHSLGKIRKRCQGFASHIIKGTSY